MGSGGAVPKRERNDARYDFDWSPDKWRDQTSSHEDFEDGKMGGQNKVTDYLRNSRRQKRHYDSRF